MVRASQRNRKGRVGLGLAAIVAAAALAVPALPALADGDGYRRGRSHQHDHGRSSHRHSHRGHSHGHSHHHHHHGHFRAGVRVHIGTPPIVIGHRPSPVYVRERVVVREPAYVAPPPPPPPQTIIISQPPPPPPPPVYVPAHTAPVIRTTPQQATVVIPSGPSAPATPAAVATPTPVAPPAPQAASPLDVLPKELSVAAYRSGHTIMVVVKGVNPAGAFSTALTAGDLHGESPEVVLRNTPVPGRTAEGETEFHVTIALKLERAVSAVTVLVADKAYRVQIVDVPSLS